MGTMQVVRGIGASISIGGRSFTKTGIAPVVFIPAYKTLSGTVWHYWAVFGREGRRKWWEEYSPYINRRYRSISSF